MIGFTVYSNHSFILYPCQELNSPMLFVFWENNYKRASCGHFLNGKKFTEISIALDYPWTIKNPPQKKVSKTVVEQPVNLILNRLDWLTEFSPIGTFKVIFRDFQKILFIKTQEVPHWPSGKPFRAQV
jgi:hypothetical protein